MKFKTTLQLLIVIITMISCHKASVAVDVSYDPETQKGILKVDDKFTFKLSEDSTSTTITITEGSHTFKLNNGKEFTQVISNKGGILNLSNEDFVVMSQPYGMDVENVSGLNANIDFTAGNHFVVIDSMLYYSKTDSLEEVSDARLKKALDMNKRLDGKGNYMKYHKPAKFIVKDWDFGLNQDFPKTIETRSSGGSPAFNTLTYKTKVIPATLFKLYALMSPQYFVVRNLKDIESGKEDIKEDREKTSKQMEFDQ